MVTDSTEMCVRILEGLLETARLLFLLKAVNTSPSAPVVKIDTSKKSSKPSGILLGARNSMGTSTATESVLTKE